jgi:hypothetical protein
MHRSQSGKLRRAAVTTVPSVLATGVRPFRVQRDEEALPSAKTEDDAAGVLDSYLNKRRIARTVPPTGSRSAGEETLQRYTVVTPNHIGMEKHAQVTTQDLAQTDYGSAYRETTYTARETGQNPTPSAPTPRSLRGR